MEADGKKAAVPVITKIVQSMMAWKLPASEVNELELKIQDILGGVKEDARSQRKDGLVGEEEMHDIVANRGEAGMLKRVWLRLLESILSIYSRLQKLLAFGDD